MTDIMANKQSTVTARDYVEAVSDVLGIEPKPENADKVQTAIEKRGGFIDPKWLLDVLTGKNENGGTKNDAV